MQDHVDVAVIGAGHAGLNAVKEIRKTTDRFVLINGGELGTTCARVGCMPSKVAIHLAELYQSRQRFGHYGIVGAEALKVDQAAALEHVRDLRDTFVDLVMANTTDEMGDELVEGFARFIDANTLAVGNRLIHAKAIVIATGASTMIPLGWKQQLGDRLLTVETLFEQERLPESVAVIGLGPIGVEMGQALHRLGTKVVGVDVGTRIARVQDPEINRLAVEILEREFPVWLGAPVAVERVGEQVRVTQGDREILVDSIFVATGRRPNIEGLDLGKVGCVLDAHGVPLYDPRTLQVGRFPIYLTGDATGGVANLQIAAAQGQVAGYNACHAKPRTLDAKTPMSIVFSDPNIAVVGTPWSQLSADVVVGQQRFGPVGRALIMGSNRGLLRLYADGRTGIVLGGAMVGPRCEHLAHLLAWGIESRMTAEQMLAMPYYHPVIEEALQDALHDLLKGLRRVAPLRTEISSRLGSVARWRRRVSAAS
ncbi:dihydrolipoyl dehydrogenase [Thiocapsa imhoffii]|uniref:Dihydrolipoyl dehydrogenase n=1 Tax=Thiocapsa imhoffii TaxID=382777 RepID=A0A9X1BAE3_9GAMM|nr:dihydrolipoyl dehydrogenase [Thiocapsa imhoffii]MBK1646025.1 dihydrolipoyl dehydrogenase [Thiocapsa imhoffii]